MRISTNDIRKKYLAYFAQQGHTILPSASIMPENDPTTLFTGSGMQPMVPYLLGQAHPAGTRLTDSQKCIRTQDIEEVGDNRHTTFFEMLGNWSLGDYFKTEQINWMFDFLIHEIGLDPKNLYITVFKGNEAAHIPRDTEAAKLWQDKFASVGVDAQIIDNPEVDGMQGGRIFYYDEKKNWWSRAGVPEKMPVGEPGGPDTEMFWDFGADRQLHEQSEWKDMPCHVNCDCGRFLEIGNNVFMQYKKTNEGFEPLPQQNVDFGGGLERIAAALNDDPDVFMIDLFATMRQKLTELSGEEYGQSSEKTRAFRIILDHMRAVVFMIADGAVPANKDQGYFSRRMIRRAIRFAHHLGITEAFCHAFGESVIDTYKEAYPELQVKKDEILSILSQEEEKFKQTLAQGLKVFEDAVSGLSEGAMIDDSKVFDLYQSYGFPFEMTEELAHERKLQVNKDQFEVHMKAHQDLSRKGAEQKFKGGLADHSEMSVKYHTATHLLHAALRAILGDSVEQKGSNITPERLRFDFSYGEKMTPEQKKAVEDLVNAAIKADYPVSFAEMSVADAKQKNAIGLFEDRYAEMVKVYTIGDPDHIAKSEPGSPTFSREICGGPHVEHTGVLGTFKIQKEEACSAGVRRIKAILE